MKLNLPPSVASPEDLQGLLLDLRTYAKWQAHNAVKKRVGAGNAAEPPVVSPAAQALLRTSGTGAAEVAKLIADCEQLAARAPQLTITLPAPPNGAIKQQLVAWCRQNISQNVLVNFQFNSTLLGGMVVRAGSHIYDWSLRRQVFEQRGKFPEVLRHV